MLDVTIISDVKIEVMISNFITIQVPGLAEMPLQLVLRIKVCVCMCVCGRGGG